MNENGWFIIRMITIGSFGDTPIFRNPLLGIETAPLAYPSIRYTVPSMDPEQGAPVGNFPVVSYRWKPLAPICKQASCMVNDPGSYA